MEKTTTSVDEYLASVPDDVRADMTTLDAAIAKVMASHERVMWEGRFWGGSDQRIIGYGDYRYEKSGGKSAEWFAVGLAAQKNYITVFVNAVVGGKYLADGYAKKLGKAKIGRSSVSFRRLSDVDLPTLVELVTRARSVVFD